MMKKAAYGKSMKAKAGTKKVKKAGYGGKAASMVPKGKSGLKKPKSSQKGLKALPTAVRNKMGFAKKGKAVTKAKSGSKMKKKKCKYGCK
jgi:hypothetical protein